MSIRNSSVRTASIAACGVILFVAATAIATGASARGQKSESMKLRVWKCGTHEQVRMLSKGKCPLGDHDLVAGNLVVNGPEPAGDPYPLETCPVSGEKLGSMGDPIILTDEGREVRLCCKGCVRSFERDPEKHWKAVDAQIVKQQIPHYPLETCPVSGESLTEMGEPIDVVWRNRLVRLCCKMCKKEFESNPARHIAKLDAAVVAAQEEHYPLETCVVAGGELGSMGGAVGLVAGNRLVEFCCAGCLSGFWKDPVAHYAKLDEAWAAN